MLILFFTYDLFFSSLIINNLGKGKIGGCCQMEESFFSQSILKILAVCSHSS